MTIYTGDWNDSLVTPLLDKGERIIVLSTYSNTIKVPYFVDYHGIKEWEWESFPIPSELLKEVLK